MTGSQILLRVLDLVVTLICFVRMLDVAAARPVGLTAIIYRNIQGKCRHYYAAESAWRPAAQPAE